MSRPEHLQRWVSDFNGPAPSGLCVCGATWSPAHERDTPGGLVPGEADVPPAVDLGPMLPEVLAERVAAHASDVDYCDAWPTDANNRGHGFIGINLAGTWVSRCSFCGWIDGADLEQQIAKRIAEHPAASPAGLLTADEHQAVEDAGQLYNLLCRIVGHGPSRAGDLGELVGHVHGIQQAVLKQAAARAYPDRYRLLGGIVGDLSVGG